MYYQNFKTDRTKKGDAAIAFHKRLSDVATIIAFNSSDYKEEWNSVESIIQALSKAIIAGSILLETKDI